MKNVFVTGGFDDLRSGHVRFLEEAARLGRVHLRLWPDAVFQTLENRPPKFPEDERLYLLRSLRYVEQVELAHPDTTRDKPSPPPDAPAIWVSDEAADSPARSAFCAAHGLEHHVIPTARTEGFPPPPPDPAFSGRERVLVTGCFDWFHSGHVRFFEEVSELGELFVVVGHDANIRLLKGEGHPLFSQDERRYMVGAIRFVRQALVSSGTGWLDAEPEIERIRPAIYAVNEDGDRPEKREYCERKGIRYVVLKRTPRPGLPRRQSTDLRGF